MEDICCPKNIPPKYAPCATTKYWPPPKHTISSVFILNHSYSEIYIYDVGLMALFISVTGNRKALTFREYSPPLLFGKADVFFF